MTKPNAMITIPHRWKPEPVYVSETATTIREACEEAVSKGVSLAHTHLTDADLSDADLTDADLSGADLFGADLPGVSLSGAVLTDADLTDADLTDADLSGADLSGADLSGAVLARARGLPDAPRVEDLDRKILDAIEAPGHGLGMGSWHTCQTTHCIAGWAVHLAGEAGYELERRVGPCAAGALIYHASVGYVPDFYEDSKKALADLRARAEKGSPTTSGGGANG